MKTYKYEFRRADGRSCCKTNNASCLCPDCKQRAGISDAAMRQAAERSIAMSGFRVSAPRPEAPYTADDDPTEAVIALRASVGNDGFLRGYNPHGKPLDSYAIALAKRNPQPASTPRAAATPTDVFSNPPNSYDIALRKMGVEPRTFQAIVMPPSRAAAIDRDDVYSNPPDGYQIAIDKMRGQR